mmetsp:Transcript_1675/g.3902  ORF Transcript_1675/g.3902 Transcript_1675/m.3902 type:complete len:374 (+) Transcript_1675:631-1752(+)
MGEPASPASGVDVISKSSMLVRCFSDPNIFRLLLLSPPAGGARLCSIGVFPRAGLLEWCSARWWSACTSSGGGLLSLKLLDLPRLPSGRGSVMFCRAVAFPLSGAGLFRLAFASTSAKEGRAMADTDAGCTFSLENNFLRSFLSGGGVENDFVRLLPLEEGGGSDGVSSADPELSGCPENVLLSSCGVGGVTAGGLLAETDRLLSRRGALKLSCASSVYPVNDLRCASYGSDSRAEDDGITLAPGSGSPPRKIKLSDDLCCWSRFACMKCCLRSVRVGRGSTASTLPRRCGALCSPCGEDGGKAGSVCADCEEGKSGSVCADCEVLGRVFDAGRVRGGVGMRWPLGWRGITCGESSADEPVDSSGLQALCSAP